MPQSASETATAAEPPTPFLSPHEGAAVLQQFAWSAPPELAAHGKVEHAVVAADVSTICPLPQSDDVTELQNEDIV